MVSTAPTKTIERDWRLNVNLASKMAATLPFQSNIEVIDLNLTLQVYNVSSMYIRNFYYTFFICNIVLKQSLFQHTDLDIMKLKCTLRFPLIVLHIPLRHELAQGWCTPLHVTVGPVHRFWNKHSSCPIPYILHPLKCNITSPGLSEHRAFLTEVRRLEQKAGQIIFGKIV